MKRISLQYSIFGQALVLAGAALGLTHCGGSAPGEDVEGTASETEANSVASKTSAVDESVGCANTDGRVEWFYLEQSGRSTVGHQWEVTPGGGWASASLGGQSDAFFPPGCAHNAAGQMHVFAIGLDQKVWVKWQNRAHDSSSYIAEWDGRLGAPPKGVIAGGNAGAVYDSSGKMEIFAISCENISVCQMYTKYQTAQNGGWSAWTPLGGNFLNSRVRAARWGQGGAVVTAIGMDGNWWCSFRQTAADRWGGWTRTNCVAKNFI